MKTLAALPSTEIPNTFDVYQGREMIFRHLSQADVDAVKRDGADAGIVVNQPEEGLIL